MSEEWVDFIAATKQWKPEDLIDGYLVPDPKIPWTFNVAEQQWLLDNFHKWPNDIKSLLENIAIRQGTTHPDVED